MSDFAVQASSQLYTPDQRFRRDQTPWTLVQGVLAPLQFLVFLVSLVLVLRFMATGEGQDLAASERRYWTPDEETRQKLLKAGELFEDRLEGVAQGAGS